MSEHKLPTLDCEPRELRDAYPTTIAIADINATVERLRKDGRDAT